MIHHEPGTETALSIRESTLVGPVAGAISRSHDFFLREQKPGGYWVAPLEADTTLESDYILMLRLLGMEAPERIGRALRYVRDRQLPSGGWNTYLGGPEEINATVKAYTALKLSGTDPKDSSMIRAREAVARLGGPARLNTYTRTYLNLIGQFPAAGIPTLPPELILNPKWSYFNIYEISSWSRAILVPLSVVSTCFPRIQIPEDQGIRELFPRGFEDPALCFQWSPDYLSWRNFFLIVDRVFKSWEKLKIQPLRDLALRRAESWILQRFEKSAGLGAIYPAMLNSILALRALGYPDSHPQFRRAMEEFEKLIMDRGDHLQFQPCESPVWDTGLTMLALLESGMDPSHPALASASEWLLERQTRDKGDWSVKNPRTPPGGWYFEYENEFYPDLDDTCVALMVLKRVKVPDNERNLEAQRRGLHWLLDMQCRNGGWASFDRDNDKTVFTKVPFADHNAMLDPPTADITGRILEMLSHFG